MTHSVQPLGGLQAVAEAGLVDDASFWDPDYMCESAWHAHAPFLFWLIGAHRPEVLVELGTHAGFSYLAACQAIERHGVTTRCYAIDSWTGDEHSGWYGDEVFAVLSDFHDRRYSSFSSLIRASFDESIDSFPDGSIDLLHLDGRHFYDDIRHDFTSWTSKLSRRAVVLIHDTNVRERSFGVGRFFEGLTREHDTFEFTHGHGLGVVLVGDEVGDRLKTLSSISRDPAATAALRSTYARLGETVALAWSRQESQRSIRAGNRKLAERDETIRRLESEQTARTASVADLESRLESEQTARTASVADLESRLRRMERLALAVQPRYPGFRHTITHPTSSFPAIATLARSFRYRSTVTSSSLFDATWYRRRYPDVARTNRDPALHYLCIGASEGRDPGPEFSTRDYLTRYPDVARAGMNPLVHYLRHGKRSGRLVERSRRPDG